MRIYLYMWPMSGYVSEVLFVFTKFSALFALPSKEAVEVLSINMMFLGVPAILQADNGKESKGAVLQLVKNHGVKAKNGQARTPHVQGMCPSLLFIQLPVNGSWWLMHTQGRPFS